MAPACVRRCAPNRKTKRKFTAADVGRIACAARAAGESNAAILREISECVDFEKQEDCDCKKAKQIIDLADTALQVAEILLSVFVPWTRLIKIFKPALKFLELPAPGLQVLTEAEYRAILAANKKAPLAIEDLAAIRQEINTMKAEFYRSVAVPK